MTLECIVLSHLLSVYYRVAHVPQIVTQFRHTENMLRYYRYRVWLRYVSYRLWSSLRPRREESGVLKDIPLYTHFNQRSETSHNDTRETAERVHKTH